MGTFSPLLAICHYPRVVVVYDIYILKSCVCLCLCASIIDCPLLSPLSNSFRTPGGLRSFRWQIRVARARFAIRWATKSTICIIYLSCVVRNIILLPASLLHSISMILSPRPAFIAGKQHRPSSFAPSWHHFTSFCQSPFISQWIIAIIDV